MILRGIAYALLLITALLLETVVAPGAEIRGVAPDFVFVTVLAVGMSGGPGVGLRYGFAAGIAVDLLSGPEASILGASALLLLLAGYLTGLIRPFITTSRVAGQLIIGGMGVALLVLLEEVLLVMLGREAAAAGALALDAGIGGLFAAAVTPLVCLLVGRIERLRPPA